MVESKYKFGVAFYRLYDYWSLGIVFEDNKLTISLFKWKLEIGMIYDSGDYNENE